jgi:hypothetical protein
MVLYIIVKSQNLRQVVIADFFFDCMSVFCYLTYEKLENDKISKFDNSMYVLTNLHRFTKNMSPISQFVTKRIRAVNHFKITLKTVPNSPRHGTIKGRISGIFGVV